MKNTLFSLLLIGFSINLVAQQFVPNELIVASTHELEQILKNNETESLGIEKFEKLMPGKFYYKVTIKNAVDLLKIKEDLSRKKGILHVSKNHIATNRLAPNDQLYSDQLAFDIVKMEEVWEVTTGGLTLDNQEIVIAVIDNGFDINHEDLIDNIWMNPGEIAGDNVDNDDNGYKDDVFGINVTSDSDMHPVLDHGTGVVGIIGAKGNNEIGITGINWDIKLMPISSNGTQSDIIEAYGYVLQQRRLFNESSGEQGAYIVATNSSFGIDNAAAEDYPLWCNLYEELGNEGVLSVVATNNSVVNVDVFGDMPSTCQSKYVIAVTNTGSDSGLEGACGTLNIDLGAPGDLCFSTQPDNDYRDFIGTSAASPMVAGAIGILYSMTNSFLETGKSRGLLACQVKEAILNSVDSAPELEGKTVSGGILNVAQALSNYLACSPGYGSEEIVFCNLGPNPATDNLSAQIVTPNLDGFEAVITNDIGQVVDILKMETVTNRQTAIDFNIADYAAGVYFLTVLTGDIKSTTKFMKI